ncbi:hypothetical protein [Streptomyces asiaticus]
MLTIEGARIRHCFGARAEWVLFYLKGLLIDRSTIVRTREDCMNDFWQIVAELAIKYGDKLGDQNAGEQSRRR